nr:hypothetical protein CFP56_50930 [Quercus suber]
MRYNSVLLDVESIAERSEHERGKMIQQRPNHHDHDDVENRQRKATLTIELLSVIAELQWQLQFLRYWHVFTYLARDILMLSPVSTP